MKSSPERNIKSSPEGNSSLNHWKTHSGRGKAPVLSPGTLALLLAGLLFTLPGFAVQAQVAGKLERIDPPELGFFGKRLMVRGVAVMAHADVSDAALEEAAQRINRQLRRAPEIAANLRLLGVQMHVIGKDQQVTDLPEYRYLRGVPFEGKQTMDERGRGYGGLHASCAEENLLLLSSDRFADHRDICSHEFAHTIMTFGLSRDVRDKIEAQRQKSVAAGKWKTMYAGANAQEFFAELSMWYFGSRGDFGETKPTPTRGARWLRSYDPEAYELLDSIYSGRLKPGEIEVTDLAPLPPKAEGQTRSRNDQPATQVLVINKTKKPIQMYWLDFEGKRRNYGTVVPGGVSSQGTYATHAWLVESGGKCLGIFVADRTIGRIVVGGEEKK
jgi:hypothetical protein